MLPRLPDGAFDLIYIDPPFNTGAPRRHRRLAVTRDDGGERVGFGGHRYRARAGRRDGLRRPLRRLRRLPRAEARARARAARAREGTLYVHLDYREAHYVKVALDGIFGRDCFLNEIIWAYDYGAKPTRRWPAKHDTILVYVRDRERYLFDADAVDREPYMAPGLVGPEKAARGKRPTDTWWHTIVADLRRRAHRLPDAEARGRRCGGSSPRPRGRAAGASTSSPARARSAPSARALGRRYVLVDSQPAGGRRDARAAEHLGCSSRCSRRIISSRSCWNWSTARPTVPARTSPAGDRRIGFEPRAGVRSSWRLARRSHPAGRVWARRPLRRCP